MLGVRANQLPGCGHPFRKTSTGLQSHRTQPAYPRGMPELFMILANPWVSFAGRPSLIATRIFAFEK
jgi:hypothetical protein